MTTQTDPPILEYQPPVPGTTLRIVNVLAVSAAALSLGNYLFTICMCGHQGMEGLPGNTVAVTLAILAFLRKAPWWERLIANGAVIFCALNLAHNVHNILWSGHHPLFP